MRKEGDILGFQQPYFFPYIGYFALLNYVDHYLFFDTPQYERRSWMNRNRILNANGDFTYISVPLLKASQKTAICDMRIDNSKKWKELLFSQLVIYKKKAPYYVQTMEFLEDALSPEFTTLSELNVFTIKAVCRYLGIATKTELFSEMNVNYEMVNSPDEWALNVAKAIGYKVYVNTVGGMEFFNKDKYTAAGIELQFFQPQIKPYVQRIGHFVEGLSIIDVMMFNCVEEIQQMLTQYILL